MKKVGLTGGIGSGKTTVAKIFETLGIPVYNADTRAKQIMRSNKNLKIEIKQLLGKDSYHTNGYPNRAYIAKKVFQDKSLLESLNKIVHPAVKTNLNDWFKDQDIYPYAIYESAIILDHNSENEFDIIISVIAPKSTRMSRVLKRDKSTEEAILKRMNNQISDKERIKKSDYIINNGDDDMIIPQVYDLHHRLIAE